MRRFLIFSAVVFSACVILAYYTFSRMRDNRPAGWIPISRAAFLDKLAANEVRSVTITGGEALVITKDPNASPYWVLLPPYWTTDKQLNALLSPKGTAAKPVVTVHPPGRMEPSLADRLLLCWPFALLAVLWLYFQAEKRIGLPKEPK